MIMVEEKCVKLFINLAWPEDLDYADQLIYNFSTLINQRLTQNIEILLLFY